MFVLQPEDRWRLVEQLLTLSGVFGILVVEVESVLSIEVGVESNVMVAFEH